jgi:hypothetical protein
VVDNTAKKVERGKAFVEHQDPYLLFRDLVLEWYPSSQSLSNMDLDSSSEELVADIAMGIVVDGDEVAQLFPKLSCKLLGEQVEGDASKLYPHGHSLEGYHLRVLTILEGMDQDRVILVSPRPPRVMCS